MHGVAAHLAEPADGRLAGPHGANRLPRPFGAPELHHGAKALDRTGPQLEGCGVVNELPPLVIVGVGEQCLDRYLLEFRIAVEFLAIRESELRGLHHGVDEFRAGDIEPFEPETLEQRQLLQHHGPLRPRPRLAYRVAAILVGERRLDGGLPARHVLSGEYAAIAFPTGVHDLLAAAETIDRLGDKTLRPYLAGALDFLLPAARAGR